MNFLFRRWQYVGIPIITITASNPLSRLLFAFCNGISLVPGLLIPGRIIFLLAQCLRLRHNAAIPSTPALLH
jgi:hypothetical protein